MSPPRSTELTDFAIKALRPRGGRYEIRDNHPKVTGLVLRVTRAGVKTFALRYRREGDAKACCLTLGTYPQVTLTEARRRATVDLARVRQGEDPQGEKIRKRAAARRQGATVAGVAELWLRHGMATKGERKGQPWRAKTRVEFERLVRRVIVPAIGNLEPEAVSKRDIRALYDETALRSESVAKHALAVLRLLYQWAAEEDHVDVVPVFPKRGTQSNKRTRVLEEDELRRVWGALDDGISGTDDAEPGIIEGAFRLLLLTAQRRGEVLSMRWVDLTNEDSGSWWTLPADRHKGGREHRVPLTAPAVEELKRLHSLTGSGEWIFPSPRADAQVPFIGNPQKAATRLWAAAKVQGATLHDLRRSAATYMTRLKVPRLITGKVLGHADTDVTARYDTHAYDREKRAALNKWADELQRIVASEKGRKAGRVLPWA